jgi:hypothetical protein
MKSYGPKVTNLQGTEIVVTEQERAKAIWLAKKYTSLVYMRRMSAVFFNFVGGYEGFAKTKAGDVSFYRENLQSFFAYQSSLTKGLALIEQGYKSGYPDVLRGCYFVDYLDSPRFDSGLENREIGWRSNLRHVGLYAWADSAMTMGARTRGALKASLAFPQILDPRFVVLPLPSNLPAPPRSLRPVVDTGGEVPTSGIWQPATVPSGCPNYLWVGRDAPPAQRAIKRLDYPFFPNTGGGSPVPAHTEYLYGSEATRWELLWEDHRYEGGQIPDESIYLDPSMEPPPWPPEVIPVGDDK